jgi:hypothetical protein
MGSKRACGPLDERARELVFVVRSSSREHSFCARSSANPSPEKYNR